jgi:uncharacterized protein
MTGTVVNAAAIIVGSLMGVLLKKGLPDRLKGTLMQGIGLGVLLIGFRMALQSENLLIVLASLVLGGIVGETINIELYLEKFGLFIQSKVDENSSIAKAFVTSSLLYCVGSMAVMGALESGLTGNHTTLYAKSILDGVTSIIFASTLGIGVLFSAIPVLIYQGAITMAASLVQPILTTAAVAEMTGTGGLLIIGIGLNVLEIKTIKVGNLLPAILFALLISTLAGLV